MGPWKGDTPKSDPTSDTMDQAPETQPEGLEDWRRSARRVTNAWNSWLAAGHCDRRARYHAFVSALADEEAAAARVKLLIESTGSRECATPMVSELAD